MSAPSPYRRMLRRETHSSRSTLAIILAFVAMVLLAWVGVESVLALFALPALLVSPADGLAAVLALNTVPVASLITGGVVVVLVGLALVFGAILPGRRSRHVAATGRTAVVVDDRVIASALARVCSHAADIDPDQVVVTVGVRSALVTVSPTSGRTVDREQILAAVSEELAAFAVTPSLRPRVVIERRGVVGA